VSRVSSQFVCFCFGFVFDDRVGDTSVSAAARSAVACCLSSTPTMTPTTTTTTTMMTMIRLVREVTEAVLKLFKKNAIQSIRFLSDFHPLPRTPLPPALRHLVPREDAPDDIEGQPGQQRPLIGPPQVAGQERHPLRGGDADGGKRVGVNRILDSSRARVADGVFAEPETP
jgi:hypothetical protein